MIRIGFVLLTHSEPDQVLALTQVLSELYDGPPIVCHHDFTQCPLDKSLFSSNVRFVEPHCRTFWGCFSIIPATIAGIRMLMGGPNPPDWFYLLSGSDYPTLSPGDVLSKLGETLIDAFIDHREIFYHSDATDGLEETRTGFARSSYPTLAYKRYVAVAVPRPSKAKPFSIPPVGRSYLHHPAWRSVFPGPFDEGFRCFAGEHWFTANGKAAEILLSETAQSRRLFDHLRQRECPEECYYHSLLANAPLKLSTNNLRYIDWVTSDAWHPRTLTVEDMPAIERCEAHFSRKIARGSDLMAELNRKLRKAVYV
jgi:hypothetical protein